MADNDIDGPFMFSFHTKMSPRGLFCALLVALAHTPGWKLSNLQDGSCRCRNLVEFDLFVQQGGLVSGCIGQVAIIDRNFCLEIYTTCEKNECLSIQQTVCLALEKACQNLSYSHKNLTFFGFPCTMQCGCQDLHSTDAYDKSGVWTERCSENRSKRPVPLAKNRLVWFRNDSSHGKLLH